MGLVLEVGGKSKDGFIYIVNGKNKTVRFFPGIW
jgi:hypothetical protein